MRSGIMDELYARAVAFHEKFDNRIPEKPTKLDSENLMDRVGFLLEELTELAAIGAETKEEKDEIFSQIEEKLDFAKNKLLNKKKSQYDPLVQQADALGDIVYLTFGSYVLMGLDPTEILTAIYHANMSKLFPDGKPHLDPVTLKVLKPDNWEKDYKPEPKIALEIEKQTQNVSK